MFPIPLLNPVILLYHIQLLATTPIVFMRILIVNFSHDISSGRNDVMLNLSTVKKKSYQPETQTRRLINQHFNS